MKRFVFQAMTAVAVVFTTAGVGARKPSVNKPELLAREDYTSTAKASIAVDRDAVYWTTGSLDVDRMNLATRKVEAIDYSFSSTSWVQLDETNVYWWSAGGLLSLPKSNKEPGHIGVPFPGKVLWLPAHGKGGILVTAMTLHGDSVYAALDGNEVSPSGIYRVRIDGSGATRVAPAGAGVYQIALDEKYLYYTQLISDTIFRAPREGGPAERWIKAGTPHGVVREPGMLCWTDEGYGHVKCRDDATGEIRIVADKQLHPGAMTSDATHLYWVNEGRDWTYGDLTVDPKTPLDNGAVMKVAKSGGPPVALASRQNWPVALAVDAEWVYFVSKHGGTVMRVRKDPERAKR